MLAHAEDKVYIKDHIASVLRREILDGVWPPRQYLDSIKALAKRFESSIMPVHQALVALEEEGLVVRRPGAGTYVTGRLPNCNPNHTALILPTTGHIYSEFAGMLLDYLHNLNICPRIVRSSGFTQAEAMVRNAYEAAELVIFNGNLHFPFDIIEQPIPRGKHLICLFECSSQALAPLMHRILIDHVSGGRIVAEHLWEKGHRKVLLLGTSTMFNEQTAEPLCDTAKAFFACWQERGGAVVMLNSLSVSEGQEQVVPTKELLRILQSHEPPTAIFGLRDFEAWQAQDVLSWANLGLFQSVEIVGYNNTPWSQAARPRISSVDWNLPAVFQELTQLCEPILSGQKVPAPACKMIQPLFIERPPE